MPAALQLAAALWRDDELISPQGALVPSGWDRLDRELPGGGWPCGAVVEVLTALPSTIEWRLTSPALRRVAAAGGPIAVVAPPWPPYLPGLVHDGLDERRLVWIRADAPAERLWVTEQLIRANACGAVVSWLPQARYEHVQRLQVAAQAFDGLVFAFRPEACRHESSAAPLRVAAGFGLDWELRLAIVKRRGPPFEGELALPSLPGGLVGVMTPRRLQPSRLLSRDLPEVPGHAVGRPAAALRPRRHAAS